MRRCLYAIFACCVLGTSAVAAPYPLEGLVIQWIQADGTRLTLRVYGDERYARTETESGYTVIYVPSDQTYYYAEPASQGHSLVPSNVAAHETPPVNLAKHLQESSEAVVARQSENAGKIAQDVSANWAARKKAVQEERARALDSEAETSDSSPLVQSPPKNNDTTLEEP